jgi:hypothetical protein
VYQYVNTAINRNYENMGMMATATHSITPELIDVDALFRLVGSSAQKGSQSRIFCVTYCFRSFSDRVRMIL